MAEPGAKEPNHLDELYAQIQLERWEQVEQMARYSVEKSPRYYYPVWALSLALQHLGRLDEAREAAETATAMAPDVHWNAIQLADTAREQGDVEVALEAAHRAIELEPMEANAHRVLAYILAIRSVPDDRYSMIDAEGALTAHSTAMRLEPGRGYDHRYQARLLERMGRTSEAATEWQRSLAVEPHLHEAVNNLALLYLPRHPIRAARLLREAARIDPSCPNPRNNLTDALHASVAVFTLLLLGVGIGSALFGHRLGEVTELLLLAAGLVTGATGAVLLWRVVPAGTRGVVVRRRWKQGVALTGTAVVVLAADLAVIVAGPTLRAGCAVLLVVTALGFLLIPRSPWSGRVSKYFGRWAVPTPSPASLRRRREAQAVSR